MIFNMCSIVVFLFIYVYVYFLFVFFNTCYNGFLRLIIYVFGNLFWYMIHLFISCYVRFYCLVALFFCTGCWKWFLVASPWKMQKEKSRQSRNSTNLIHWKQKTGANSKNKDSRNKRLRKDAKNLAEILKLKEASSQGRRAERRTPRGQEMQAVVQKHLRKQPPQNHRCTAFIH